jgi:type IV pilus assembly protein PilM
LANLLLGVDIGSKYTKVVVLEQGVKMRLVDGFLFNTPLKAARDGDKQVDPEVFLKELVSFLPAARLRSAKIAVNLPPMSITALSVFLPLMSRKELSFAAVNEAKQKMIPVTGPNHIFDCLFLGETAVNKIPRAEVIVIRTEKVYVQRIIDIFKSLEVHPALISPVTTILPNIVPKEYWKKGEAVVIVDIGASYLKISICSDGNMVFMRNIVFGLEDVIQDFSRQLNLKAGEVEAVIKEHGIPEVSLDLRDKVAIAEEIMRQKYEDSLNSEAASKSKVNLLELRWLWQPHLERIAQELRRTFVFYNERSEGRKIGQIFFIGGGSNIKNLHTVLSPLAGGECKIMLPFAQTHQELSSTNKFKNEIVSSAIFASAGSLVFGIPVKKGAKDAQINYLPEELKKKEAIAARRVIILIIGICFISFFFLGMVQLFFRNQIIKGNIRTVDQKLSRVKKVSDDLKVLDKNQGKSKQRSLQIEALIGSRADFILPLKGLAKAMPEEIVLTKCVLTLDKIEIEGRIFADYEEANKIIGLLKLGLAKNGIFKNIAVPDIELENMTPELNSAGGTKGKFLLTQPKERSFRLSADVILPKVALDEGRSKIAEKKNEIPQKEANKDDE